MTKQFIKNSNKVVILWYCLLFCQFAMAQNNFEAIDKALKESEQALSKNMVTLIYKEGKIIYKKEAGTMTTQSQEPIASCSKWLTAALVMTLVDEGKLSLDDKVSKYLPIYETYGKTYITLRHCLSHQTGIRQEPIKLLTLFNKKHYATLEEEVNDYASKREIDFNCGTGFFYGEIGLNIAARVLEVISKKDFCTLMDSRILKPLGMKQTSFDNGNRAPNPSGGAVSTASDYMQFLSMLLNKGAFNIKRILSEHSVEIIMQAQTTLDKIKYAPKVAEGFNYALGSWIQEADSKGNPIVLTCPGLFGTWPLIDKCRNYACIFFIKGMLGTQKRDAYLAIKKAIDEVLPTNCN